VKFRTMTPSGLTGSEYEASDAETAAQMAEKDGYEIVDIMDDILVIED
jgi:hypothetical protein